MDKTIEATWRDGFLKPEALVAPKVNDLYGRKSAHMIDRIQRMLKINEIAIIIGAPIMWIFLEVVGIPYTGAITWALLMGLLLIRRTYILRFEPPEKSLDSYQYLTNFSAWLKDRMARSRRIQRHFYALFVLALMFGIGGSGAGQSLIRALVENNADLRLVNGVPVVVIAVVTLVTITVELLGGVIFDWDVSTAYRAVFSKLDQMVAEMEELRS